MKKLSHKIRAKVQENKSGDTEPYYNDKFQKEFKKFLMELGYEDIEFDSEGVDFHNANDDNGTLINKDAVKIGDFIESYGYDSGDFIIRKSRIEYPTNF